MSRTVSFRGPLRYALWPSALVLGIVAEWIGRPELVSAIVPNISELLPEPETR